MYQDQQRFEEAAKKARVSPWAVMTPPEEALDIREQFAQEVARRQALLAEAQHKARVSVPVVKSSEKVVEPAKIKMPKTKKAETEITKKVIKREPRKGLIARTKQAFRFIRKTLLWTTGVGTVGYAAALGAYHTWVVPHNPKTDVNMNVGCHVETTKGVLSNTFNILYSREKKRILSAKGNGAMEDADMPQEAASLCLDAINDNRMALKSFKINYNDGMFGQMLVSSRDGFIMNVKGDATAQKYLRGVEENFINRTGYQPQGMIAQGMGYLFEKTGIQGQKDIIDQATRWLYPWNDAPAVLPGASCTIVPFNDYRSGVVSTEMAKPPVKGQFVPQIEDTAGNALRRCAAMIETQSQQGIQLFAVQFTVQANMHNQHSYSNMGDSYLLAHSDPKYVAEAAQKLRYVADITDRYYEDNNGLVYLNTRKVKLAWDRTVKQAHNVYDTVTSEPLMVVRSENKPF